MIQFVLVCGPQLTFGKTEQCSSADLRESFTFLNDYLGCIAGNSDICNSIVNVVAEGALKASVPGAVILSEYSYRKIQKTLENIVKDHKKLASDSQFAKRIANEVGGEDVDDWVSKNGGTLEDAKAAIEARIKRGIDMPEMTFEEAEELKRLEKLKGNISARMKYKKENGAVVQRALEKPKSYNDRIVAELEQVDLSIGRHQAALSAGDKAGKKETQAALKAAEARKKELMSGLQTIDTKVQVIADGFNPQIDEYIKRLRTQAAQNPQSRKALEASIAELEKRKIVADPSASSKYQRLSARITQTGFSVADVNGPSAKNPAWAKDMRESAIRDFPDILLKEIAKDPSLKKDPTPDRLYPRLAAAEHERWRKYTADYLYDSFVFEGEMNKRFGIQTPDVGFKTDRHGKLKTDIPLTDEQRLEFQKLKPNWLKTDVPFAQLHVGDAKYTIDQVTNELAQSLPGWEKGQELSKTQKFFLQHPRFGRMIRKPATRLLSVGGVLGGAFTWWDWYDTRDFWAGLAFETDWVKSSETANAMLSSQCRLPDKMEMNQPNVDKKVTKWFCGCETNNRKVDQLNVRCQRPVSMLSAEERKICAAGLQSGRDRDLKIALQLKESNGKKLDHANILKDSVGCDVMKNHWDNCRSTSTDITDQGIYFMSIIGQMDLQNEVTQLCPDVCAHWRDVALTKIKQIRDLEGVIKLPTTKEENKAPAGCVQEFYAGNPPDNFEQRKKWKECQPPIQCRADRSVRVNVLGSKRDLEYYEIQFNKSTHDVSTLKHYRTDIQQKFNDRGHMFLLAPTKPTFSFHYDNKGDISRLQTYDWQTQQPNETVLSSEILSTYKEYAYNANSFMFSGRNTGEFAVSRRIETLLLNKRAQTYCCTNEWDCDADGTASGATPSPEIPAHQRR